MKNTKFWIVILGMLFITGVQGYMLYLGDTRMVEIYFGLMTAVMVGHNALKTHQNLTFLKNGNYRNGN